MEVSSWSNERIFIFFQNNHLIVKKAVLRGKFDCLVECLDIVKNKSNMSSEEAMEYLDVTEEKWKEFEILVQKNEH